MTSAPRNDMTALADGIYIASKTKHAHRWLALRDAGEPIISTWIDEAGEGQSADLHDLWRRCVTEASSCGALVVYRENDDVLKGGWVEVGAALALGVPVFAVGLGDFTISKYREIIHCYDIESAFAAARRALTRPAIEAERDDISASRVAEVVAEGDGVWRTCTGCHNTIDGYDDGFYPISKTLGCKIGSGCRECGGLGATWDDTDYAAMAEAMSRDVDPSPAAVQSVSDPAPDSPSTVSEIAFIYVNYRGEESKRRARPISIRYGKSEYHDTQWLMLAHDLDKGEDREFAMRDMTWISPARAILALIEGRR